MLVMAAFRLLRQLRKPLVLSEPHAGRSLPDGDSGQPVASTLLAGA